MTETACIQTRFASNAKSSNEENLMVNAFPNPFKSIATFEFQKDDKVSHVVLVVYSLTGEKIATLFDAKVEPGITYKAEFNAEGLPDGIYLYRLESEDGVANGKLILMK